MYFGYAEKKGIDEGRRDPANRGQAVAALVIGGIVTALYVLFFCFIVIAAFAGVLGGLWGGMISVRAATKGPQWALDYLKKAYPFLFAPVFTSALACDTAWMNWA